MKEVGRMHVWSNGKTIRVYRAQDRKIAENPEWHTNRTPEKGYRKMIAVLYEITEFPDRPAQRDLPV